MTPRKTQRVHDGEVALMRVSLKVALLRSKVLNRSKILDSSQQLLKNAVTRTSSVSGKFMARKLNLIPRQTTLLTPLSNSTLLTESSAIVVNVEGHVELLVLGILLEALLAVPSSVLESEEGSVGWEKEVKTTDSDDGVVSVFDNALENVVLGRGKRSVAAVGVGVAKAEDIVGSALIPSRIGGGVEGLLHVCSVEVDLGTGGRIVALNLLVLVMQKQ